MKLPEADGFSSSRRLHSVVTTKGQPMTSKTCSKCGIAKQADEYHRDRKSADGLFSWCKTCVAERDRAYYAANKERIDARQRAYREANPELYAETHRAWCEANRERNAETKRAWHEANPDKVAEKRNRYRAKYPDRYLARVTVRNAVVAGKLVPVRDLTCTTCGASAEEYHHHNGYAPEHVLDVVPLCRACHTELHKEAL